MSARAGARLGSLTAPRIPHDRAGGRRREGRDVPRRYRKVRPVEEEYDYEEDEYDYPLERLQPPRRRREVLDF